MAGYSSYGRQLCAQPDPHGESYGAGGKKGYFPRDPYAETWTVPASKNRGLSVPPGYRNEIGHSPSAATLRVDRQLHLDTKTYFRWTRWKATHFGIWGVVVPLGIYMAITNEMVSMHHSLPGVRVHSSSPLIERTCTFFCCAYLRRTKISRRGTVSSGLWASEPGDDGGRDRR
jgi:hypothetical protein